MRTFDTQLEFEEYWKGVATPVKPAGYRGADKGFFVYFTASWCGPCRRLDIDAIESAAKSVGVPIWKVEQTVNDYTAGYCNVRSLPTFLFITPLKIVNSVSSSRTEDVVAWIKSAELAK